jgi:hypothetical protein
MSSLLGLEEESKSGGSGAMDADQEDLAARVKHGANWFYWIAGLSVVNTLVYVSGSNVAFLAGLGLTQLTDALVDVAIENGAPAAMKIVAVVFTLALVIIFALFGYFGGKRSSAAFLVGIVIYVLDGLLLLMLGELFGFGFHVFALIFIVRGFLACRTLNAIDAARALQPPPPPPLQARI